MHSFKTLFVCAGLAGAGLPLSSAQAAIADGYVCSASYDPRPGQAGTYGGIDLVMHGGPDCTGSNLGSFRVLTTGADSSLAGFRYASWQITVMFDQLLRAAAEGTRVRFGYNTGNGALQITFSRSP